MLGLIKFGTGKSTRRHVLLVTTILLLTAATLPETSLAQGILSVSPESLHVNTERDIYLTNTGTDTLRLDSLAVSPDQCNFVGFEVVQADTVSDHIGFDSDIRKVRDPGVGIVPGDTTILRTTYFSRCVGTNQNQLGRLTAVADTFILSDTLRIFSQAATPNPTRVFLSAERTRSAVEDPLPAGTKPTVQVVPNPVREDALITIEASSTGRYRLALFDLLGRQVVVAQPVYLLGGEQRRIRWSSLTDPLPAGRYFLRLSAHGGRSITYALTTLK